VSLLGAGICNEKIIADRATRTIPQKRDERGKGGINQNQIEAIKNN